ncbi:MAG: hypothetical protein OEZ16_07005 [Chromatiales bacterium]|nr:hypothetical protein [Chromatiales bacterium]
MDEWQYEQAQRREVQEREAAIAEVRKRAARRYTPYMLDGEPCCPDCLEPLAAHRIEVGICVHCLSLRERTEQQHGS